MVGWADTADPHQTRTTWNIRWPRQRAVNKAPHPQPLPDTDTAALPPAAANDAWRNSSPRLVSPSPRMHARPSLLPLAVLVACGRISSSSPDQPPRDTSPHICKPPPKGLSQQTTCRKEQKKKKGHQRPRTAGTSLFDAQYSASLSPTLPLDHSTHSRPRIISTKDPIGLDSRRLLPRPVPHHGINTRI